LLQGDFMPFKLATRQLTVVAFAALHCACGTANADDPATQPAASSHAERLDELGQAGEAGSVGPSDAELERLLDALEQELARSKQLPRSER
jgi:hypothetical protein